MATHAVLFQDQIQESGGSRALRITHWAGAWRTFAQALVKLPWSEEKIFEPFPHLGRPERLGAHHLVGFKRIHNRIQQFLAQIRRVGELLFGVAGGACCANSPRNSAKEFSSLTFSACLLRPAVVNPGLRHAQRELVARVVEHLQLLQVIQQHCLKARRRALSEAECFNGGLH